MSQSHYLRQETCSFPWGQQRTRIGLDLHVCALLLEAWRLAEHCRHGDGMVWCEEGRLSSFLVTWLWPALSYNLHFCLLLIEMFSFVVLHGWDDTLALLAAMFKQAVPSPIQAGIDLVCSVSPHTDTPAASCITFLFSTCCLWRLK